ncbi:GvpL/GvpF family gas vesicle protein [Streptomyces poriticola]|uniref:GvpL/GvpF family gas vesicle protein n=1 Tax=Streptomyces poriticola TaxID=3120506 RepID=UPI002FCE4075
MSTYVYGITASSHPPPAEGTGGVGEPPRAVRVLTEGALAALVSDAPEGLRPEDRELLAHEQVIAEASAAGCVLPLRFGSLAPDDRAVTGVLAERAEHYTERLRALEGRVEYRLAAGRRSGGDDAALRRALEPEAEDATVGTDAGGRLADVAFLVERTAAERFLAAVERVRRDLPHLDVRVDGPLPPYSFVEPGPAEPAAPRP